MNGHTNVIQEILHKRSDSATNLIESEGTILHICIKFNQYESFKLLVENNPDSVSVKDNDHNNVFHIVVSQKNAEVRGFKSGFFFFFLPDTDPTKIIEYLIDTTAIDGFTALDLSTLGRMDQKDWMIEKVLLSFGAKHANDVFGSTHMATTSTIVSQINNAPFTASRSNLCHILNLNGSKRRLHH
ncbi:hypothetical protein EZV62_013113 [Acer yangbiense]|uniref:PGG domain-containing protein n=1 Tax=Acer yangbiense TaxID=1000413 RepID=A0A5C7HXY2_9ROSI|nr:hypothetical protein EZV62_013113 [Acer yangbiense]